VDTIRRDKTLGKETALKLLEEITERHRKQLSRVIEAYRLEKAELDRNYRAQNIQKRYKFSNKGVQTDEAVNNQSMHDQVGEQAMQIHNLLT